MDSLLCRKERNSGLQDGYRVSKPVGLCAGKLMGEVVMMDDGGEGVVKGRQSGSWSRGRDGGARERDKNLWAAASHGAPQLMNGHGWTSSHPTAKARKKAGGWGATLKVTTGTSRPCSHL